MSKAEIMRRYRQKMRSDPAKIEAARAKDMERKKHEASSTKGGDSERKQGP